MRRHLLGRWVAIAAIVTGGVFVWLRSAQPPAATRLADSTANGREPPVSPGDRPPAHASAVESSAESSQDTPAPAPQRHVVEHPPDATTGAAGAGIARAEWRLLDVTVVDAASRSPCPGAEWMTFRVACDDQFDRWLGDLASLREHSDERTLTDGSGGARVRCGDAGAWLIALAGDRWGALHVDDTVAASVTMEVAPRRAVEVDVVPADGAPATRIELHLAALLPDPEGQRPVDDRQRRFCTAHSDAHGRARRFGGEFLRPASDESLAILALASMAETVVVELSPPLPPPAPVRVVLPPLGFVEVRLVDSRGELVAQDAHLTVMANGPGIARGDLHDLALLAGRSAPIPVGLGTQLWAFVGLAGHWQQKASRLGPTTAGETVVLDVVLESTRTVSVLGALVKEDGTPVSGAIHLAWMIPTAQRGRFENPGHGATADEPGGFAAPLSELAFAHGSPTLVISAEDPAGFSRRSETLTLVRDGDTETIDLGEEIVLHGAAGFLEGVVVDGEGQPVRGVQLSASLRQPAPSEANEPETPPGFDEFMRVDRADGRFRIPVRHLDDHFHLSAHATLDGWAASCGTEWRASDGLVTLVLQARGAVAGHVRLPPDLPPNSIQIGLRLPESRGRDGSVIFEGAGWRRTASSSSKQTRASSTSSSTPARTTDRSSSSSISR